MAINSSTIKLTFIRVNTAVVMVDWLPFSAEALTEAHPSLRSYEHYWYKAETSVFHFCAPLGGTIQSSHRTYSSAKYPDQVSNSTDFTQQPLFLFLFLSRLILHERCSYTDAHIHCTSLRLTRYLL